MRRLKKLNVRILCSLQNHGNAEGEKFMPGMMFPGIKVIFLEFCSIRGDKY